MRTARRNSIAMPPMACAASTRRSMSRTRTTTPTRSPPTRFERSWGPCVDVPAALRDDGPQLRHGAQALKAASASPPRTRRRPLLGREPDLGSSLPDSAVAPVAARRACDEAHLDGASVSASTSPRASSRSSSGTSPNRSPATRSRRVISSSRAPPAGSGHRRSSTSRSRMWRSRSASPRNSRNAGCRGPSTRLGACRIGRVPRDEVHQQAPHRDDEGQLLDGEGPTSSARPSRG